jgi:hypothetical protein
MNEMVNEGFDDLIEPQEVLEDTRDAHKLVKMHFYYDGEEVSSDEEKSSHYYDHGHELGEVNIKKRSFKNESCDNTDYDNLKF